MGEEEEDKETLSVLITMLIEWQMGNGKSERREERERHKEGFESWAFVSLLAVDESLQTQVVAAGLAGRPADDRHPLSFRSKCPTHPDILLLPFINGKPSLECFQS